MADTPVPARRSTGVTILAIGVVIVGLSALMVAREYLSWMVWRFDYDDAIWGIVDMTLALAYLGLAVNVFVAATRIWSVESEAWRQALLACLALVGLDLLSVVVWGLTTSDVIGLVAYGVVIGWLNLTSIRAAFGRSPVFG